jgi:hypothetical protein
MWMICSCVETVLAPRTREPFDDATMMVGGRVDR